MTNTVSGVNLRPDQGNRGEGNRGDELGLGKCSVKIFRLTGEGTEGNKMEHCLWRQSSSRSRGQGGREQRRRARVGKMLC